MTTISILEDQPVVRESLALMLEAEGVQVLGHYGDPRAFLAGVRAHPPQAVMVDLRLEGEQGDPATGFSVIRSIHVSMPQVKILVLSGVEDTELIRACYENGAHVFLPKRGVDRPRLLEALEAALRAERWLPAELTEVRDSGASAVRAEPSRLDRLTRREREVLGYVAAGSDNLKISACLGISERTVKAHITNVYRKLGPENRAQMALLARELGVIPPSDA